MKHFEKKTEDGTFSIYPGTSEIKTAKGTRSYRATFLVCEVDGKEHIIELSKEEAWRMANVLIQLNE
jgi:hypothetical protein